MAFDLEGTVAVLERTRAALRGQFGGLPDAWTSDDEGPGTHPEFGRVALGQLLATWTVHDLGHLAQICRVMAGRYREEVGPWRACLPIVAPRR